jgi:hypothetical protein
MASRESIQDFQARFSQFSTEQQHLLFKEMSKKMKAKTTKPDYQKLDDYCPKTPPRQQPSKRPLESPFTPHHGGSRKVILVCDMKLNIYRQVLKVKKLRNPLASRNRGKLSI